MPLVSMAHIIGATGWKTPNSLALDSGQVSNVCCGADILLTGMYHNLKGETVCPVCAAKISVVVEDQRVASVTPQSAILHYVKGPTFSICCEGTFIFDREDCLKDWLISYEGDPGTVSPLSDFMSEALAPRGPQTKRGSAKILAK